MSSAESVAFDGRGPQSGLTLLDYGQNPPELSEARRATDPNFASFAEEIRRVSAQEGLRLDGLRLVRLPISAPGDRARFAEAAAPGELCLDSPWARLFRAAGGIGGHVLWSERQFLRDRLGRGDWETPPLPFPQEEFGRWAAAYAATLGGRGDGTAALIPADLARLFQEAPQSTRGPFSGGASGAMRRISQEMSGAYAEQILRLIRRCAEGGPPLRLRTPADLAAAFGPSAYSAFSR